MCRRRRRSRASPMRSKQSGGTGRRRALTIFTRCSSAWASLSPPGPSNSWMRSSSGCRWRLSVPSASSPASSWWAISSAYSSRSLNHRPGSSCLTLRQAAAPAGVAKR